MSMDDTDHALEVYKAFHPNAQAQKADDARKNALADLIGKVAAEAFTVLTEEPDPEPVQDDPAAQALVQAVEAMTAASAAQTKAIGELCARLAEQGQVMGQQAAAVRELAAAVMAPVVPIRDANKLITELRKKKP